jgi:GH24 family phage-related lysozyme (muramidase)
MNRDALRKQLRIDEGWKKKPYRDTVGKLTGGCGRNLDDKGFRDSEIAFMLENDIDEVVADLDRALPWWREMSEARQDVLVNMCFNLGLPKLLGFKNTLASMQRGDYLAAAEGMKQSNWYRQVGARADRLIEIMKAG